MRLTFFKIFLFLFPLWESIFFHHASFAAYVSIGKAKTKKTTFAFEVQLQNDPKNPLSSEKESLNPLPTIANTLKQTLYSDLLFYDDFELQEKNPNLLIQLLCSQNILLKTVRIRLVLWNQLTHEKKWDRIYDTPFAGLTVLAHTAANDIINAITGKPGVFLTKIAMCCEVKGKQKEIFITDFDGSHTQQITFDRSLALSPAWSPDGTKIAYSVYQRRRNGSKNIDLFELDLKTRQRRLLSNRKGINSGATYTPDGKKLFLTMSYSGMPVLNWLDLQSLLASPLPNTIGYDVDPAFNPDGKTLAYISLRSGNPMVYLMKLALDYTTSTIERLTYAGRYNATPSWSATNDKIVFAGWTDKSFDIFLIHPDGTTLERLTRNQGNNEDPCFSPDGKFIVFSSNRIDKKKNIFMMNTNGTFIKRLTYGLGDCVSPKWSASLL